MRAVLLAIALILAGCIDSLRDTDEAPDAAGDPADDPRPGAEDENQTEPPTPPPPTSNNTLTGPHETFQPPPPQPLAVVAVIDSGIDPWHAAFRDGTGVVADLPFPLPATVTDKAGLDALEPRTLVAFPGTRVLGITFGPLGTPVYDDNGHGTATAGLAVKDCPRCIVVAIEIGSSIATVEDALHWVADQDWIDAVSLSLSPAILGLVGGADWIIGGTTADATRAVAASGKIVVAASGNDVFNLGLAPRGTSLTSSVAGPPWVLSVGAWHTACESPTTYHSVPVDVVGPSHLQAPAPGGNEQDFGGTSAAAPGVANAILRAIVAARDPAIHAGPGPLDGSLVARQGQSWTWRTIVDATKALARPVTGSGVGAQCAPDPTPLGTGYGLVDAQTVPGLTDVLTGRSEAPERADVEAWASATNAARVFLWGPSP